MIAKVYMNEIEVGCITENQYKEIKKRAFNSWKNHVLQSLNFISLTFIFLCRVLCGIPLTWFVALTLCALFSQESITQLFTLISEQTPIQNTDLIISLFKISFLISFFSTVVASFFGIFNNNYRNVYKRDIKKSIRCALELPEDGNLSVRIMD